MRVHGQKLLKIGIGFISHCQETISLFVFLPLCVPENQQSSMS